MRRATVDDGDRQLDGLDFDVRAECVALRKAVLVAVNFDLRLVRPERQKIYLKSFKINHWTFV